MFYKILGTLSVIGLVTFALFSAKGFSCGWGDTGRWMHDTANRGWHGCRWMHDTAKRDWNVGVPEKYQLTPDQISSIQDIRSKYHEKNLPLINKLRELRIKARNYSSRSDADIKQIRDYRKQIRDLEDKIEDNELSAQAEMNKILSKEQRTFFSNNQGSYAWYGECCMGDHRASCADMMDCPRTNRGRMCGSGWAGCM